MRKLTADTLVGLGAGLVVAITPYFSVSLGNFAESFHNFISASSLSVSGFFSYFVLIIFLSTPILAFYLIVLKRRGRFEVNKPLRELARSVIAFLGGILLSYGIWFLMILKAVSNWTLF